jgi:hypothetical protein
MGSATDVRVLNDSVLNQSEKDEGSSAKSKGALVCPTCGTLTLYRVSRKGFAQRVVFARFGYFPWDCKTCKVVQLLKNRGTRRRRGKSDN